mgnify:FL=1
MISADLKAHSVEVFLNTGYPIEIFQSKNLMEQMLCVICLGVFRNPCTLFPCGHSLCKLCAYDLCAATQGRASCPRCRKQITASLEVMDLKSIIKLQTVACPMRAILDKPCVWTGTVEALDAHLIKECEYRVVKCQCGKYLHKNDLIGNDVPCDCPEVICKYCNLRFYSRNDHELACREVIDQHKCGALIKRKDLEQHETLCPEMEVICKFCTAVCLRKNKKNHNEYDCKEVMILCKTCANYVKRRDLITHQQSCNPPKFPGLAWLKRVNMKSKITDADF